jgi:hypothetical protein
LIESADADTGELGNFICVERLDPISVQELSSGVENRLYGCRRPLLPWNSPRSIRHLRPSILGSIKTRQSE